MCFKHKRSIGRCITGLGVILILALILPSDFWWVILGLGLVIAGIIISKK